MDLQEVTRTLRRHWIIAVLGLALAVGLGALTYTARGKSKYTSTATLFVRQGKFPYAGSVSNAAANDNLTNLAYLYAQIAQSDLIRETIGAPPNTLAASVVTSGAFSSGVSLPFLDIAAEDYSPGGAQRRAQATVSALRRYVLQGEVSAGTPVSSRVSLQEITAAQPGKPNSTKTRVVLLPGVVAVTVLLLALGLIFVLENLARPPRPRALGESSPDGTRSSERSNWTRLGSRGGEGVEPAPLRGALRRNP